MPSTTSENCHITSGCSGLPKLRQFTSASGRAPVHATLRAASSTTSRPPVRGSSSAEARLAVGRERERLRACPSRAAPRRRRPDRRPCSGTAGGRTGATPTSCRRSSASRAARAARPRGRRRPGTCRAAAGAGSAACNASCAAGTARRAVIQRAVAEALDRNVGDRRRIRRDRGRGVADRRRRVLAGHTDRVEQSVVDAEAPGVGDAPDDGRADLPPPRERRAPRRGSRARRSRASVPGSPTSAPRPGSCPARAWRRARRRRPCPRRPWPRSPTPRTTARPRRDPARRPRAWRRGVRGTPRSAASPRTGRRPAPTAASPRRLLRSSPTRARSRRRCRRGPSPNRAAPRGCRAPSARASTSRSFGQDAEAEHVHERVAAVRVVEHDLAADRRDADRVAVAGDAGHDTFEEVAGARVVEDAEAQRVHQRDRPRAHREDVADDAADAGGRALVRLDRGRVVVALDAHRDRRARRRCRRRPRPHRDRRAPTAPRWETGTRCARDDLYEQCSDHITEYIASSRCVGSRPSSSTTAASSSSVIPSCRCSGSVADSTTPSAIAMMLASTSHAQNAPSRYCSEYGPDDSRNTMADEDPRKPR